LENATPYLGTKGDLSRVKEYKLETIVREQDLAEVVKQMKALHVYEEVAYDVIKLENAGDEVGLGRWTEIEATTMDLLRQKFTDATFSGDLTTNKIVTKIGFCGGSGGTLVKDAQSLGLQVLVSSEFGYHEELYAKDYGITLIDLGHKASEEPVLDVLAKLLETKIKDLKILVC